MKINNLCKNYGELSVLDNINLEIEEGKITCLMGASGRGKTTLLRIISGLENADSGSVQYVKKGGDFTDNVKEISVGMVFQEDRLCEGFTAYENVKFVAKPVKTSNFDIKNKIKTEFNKLNLGDFVDTKVSKLSGGMRRRVSILQALLSESDLILMDEPLTGLDDDIKDKVVGYIKEKAFGKTVIMVTHDEREAEALADKIVRL